MGWPGIAVPPGLAHWTPLTSWSQKLCSMSWLAAEPSSGRWLVVKGVGLLVGAVFCCCLTENCLNWPSSLSLFHLQERCASLAWRFQVLFLRDKWLSTMLARKVTTSAEYYKSLNSEVQFGHPLEKWKSQIQPERWVGKVIYVVFVYTETAISASSIWFLR